MKSPPTSGAIAKASAVSAGATERRALRSSTRSAATNPVMTLPLSAVRRRKCSSRSSCSTARRVGGCPPATSVAATSSGRCTARGCVSTMPPSPAAGSYPAASQQRARSCGVARLHDQTACAPFLHLLRAQLLDQAPAVDDPDARRQPVHLGEDVARHEDGDAALGGERTQQGSHLDDAGRVEAVGRLVEDDELGLVEERHGEPEPLAVALRQGVRPAPGIAVPGRAARRRASRHRRRCRAGAPPSAGSRATVSLG